MLARVFPRALHWADWAVDVRRCWRQSVTRCYLGGSHCPSFMREKERERRIREMWEGSLEELKLDSDLGLWARVWLCH